MAADRTELRRHAEELRGRTGLFVPMDPDRLLYLLDHVDGLEETLRYINEAPEPEVLWEGETGFSVMPGQSMVPRLRVPVGTRIRVVLAVAHFEGLPEDAIAAEVAIYEGWAARADRDPEALR